MSGMLKPCPFCGNTEIDVQNSVWCKRCGALVSFLKNWESLNPKDQVIRWNRRAEVKGDA